MYAWVITKDHTDFDPNEPASATIEGLRGPRNCGLSVEEIQAHGIPFQMLDAEGRLIVDGYLTADPPVARSEVLKVLKGFEPMDDYGDPALGARRIQYRSDHDHMTGDWHELS